jgi:hypothetical protein
MAPANAQSVMKLVYTYNKILYVSVIHEVIFRNIKHRSLDTSNVKGKGHPVTDSKTQRRVEV